MLHQSNSLYSITCFMEPPPSLLRSEVYKFNGYATENTPLLTGISIHIYLLSNMDLEITKKGSMVKQVVDILNLDLDMQDIRGGYNTKKFMEKFRV